jgi:ribosomal protein S18 acetylase RimI-like enzyme
MISIVRATLNHNNLLTDLGKTTFLEAHGKSASAENIEVYVSKKFTTQAFEKELKDNNTIFYILYFNNKAVGYSKIIINSNHPNIGFENVTKLERLYVLQEFHGLKLGLELFNFNLNETIKHNQNGMWLFVWTENHKAINFYRKTGFEIIGHYDFEITPTHANPNYQMLLTF